MISARNAEGDDLVSRSNLEELYWEHYSEAVRLAYLLTGNRDSADDLAQDAFLRMFTRFQDLRKQEAFRAYLRRTVVNLSRDRFRRLRRERAALETQRILWKETQVQVDVEARDELLTALQELPARQRAAIVLRYCEGLREEEAAEVLGTTVGATKSLTSRGLKTLRVLLEVTHDTEH